MTRLAHNRCKSSSFHKSIVYYSTGIGFLPGANIGVGFLPGANICIGFLPGANIGIGFLSGANIGIGFLPEANICNTQWQARRIEATKVTFWSTGVLRLPLDRARVSCACFFKEKQTQPRTKIKLVFAAKSQHTLDHICFNMACAGLPAGVQPPRRYCVWPPPNSKKANM